MSNYIIGIDLGTTNCTMAYMAVDGEEISLFEISQRIAAGTVGEKFSLPSFLYFPLEEEEEEGPCVGLFARERGGELVDRMVTSAKSWLCHAGIDRREKLLPYSSIGEKVSPVAACAEYLKHLRKAWDSKMGETPFSEQKILVTVPASFDPSARQLVEEAAEMAEYPNVVLLEEPQAAFYAWLHKNEQWRDQLQVGDRILVIDVGGGTTDFSLISVAEEEGDLSLERLAVGSHLLLGGDNMDLALAHLMKNKFEEEGSEIDDWQMQQLVHSCRKAKETLMEDDSPDMLDVTIQGRGSSIIGGSLTTTLTRDEVHTLLVEGFMPLTDPEERSSIKSQAGLQQVGLPYAQDPRISCQLAKFLSMTGEDDSESMDNFVMPTAVLFNGGTMKGQALRNRMIELLNSWAEKMEKDPIKVLPDADLDYAVSRGAAYYGSGSVRIKAGTSRSYYIGVESAAPAVPGIPTPMTAVCVVPYGMEEGTEQKLNDRDFALVLGQQATFRFFSRATPTLSDGTEPVMGTTFKRWKQELTELHPIETVLDRDESDGMTVRVKLKSVVTELGVLQLWCVADDDRKWKLEFDIRQEAGEVVSC